MVRSQRRPLRINALLKSIYTDLRHPASFSSPYTLFRATKQKNPNILYKDVESWLETQPVYTKYRRIKVKHPRHKVLSRGLRYQYQADLVDYSALKMAYLGSMSQLRLQDELNISDGSAFHIQQELSGNDKRLVLYKMFVGLLQDVGMLKMCEMLRSTYHSACDYNRHYKKVVQNMHRYMDLSDK